jgi:hypothetical protein
VANISIKFVKEDYVMKKAINKKNNFYDLEASDGMATLDAQVKEILEKLIDKNYEWLLIVRQYDFPCDATIHNTKEDLIYDLGNVLTCSCLIVGIYHQGRRLSKAEIGPLEKEALDGLGPISRARAEGKI